MVLTTTKQAPIPIPHTNIHASIPTRLGDANLHAPGLEDGAVEELAGETRGCQSRTAEAARTLPEDGHVVRVAPEVGDVLLWWLMVSGWGVDGYGFGYWWVNAHVRHEDERSFVVRPNPIQSNPIIA